MLLSNDSFRDQGHANRCPQDAYPTLPQHSTKRWGQTKAVSGKSPTGTGDLETLENVSVPPKFDGKRGGLKFSHKNIE